METVRTIDQPDDGLIRRTFGITIKSIDEKNRSAHFVFSDASLDSFDEIVDQDWDLSRYQKNPVVLYNHNRGTQFVEPRHSLPIGHAERVGIMDGCLQGDVFFLSEEANPLAEQCWKCLKEGALRAGSVGFAPGDVRSEQRDGRDIYRLSKSKLFEFSLTPIGACENAIANSAGAQRDHEILKTLAAKTAARTEKYGQPPINKSPSGEERAEMDPEKMKADIERLTNEKAAETLKVTAAEKTITDLNTKLLDTETKLTKALADVSEADGKIKAFEEANTKLEGENIAAEVNLLVGKKITPAQLEDYIELRVGQGPEKFAKFVSNMADLPYSKNITGKTLADATNTATGRRSAASSAVLKAAQEAARKAANKISGDDA